MAGHIASSASVHWGTPEFVVATVRRFFGEIDLDPCSGPQSIVRAREEWTLPAHDGLREPWGARRAYVNPPFGTYYQHRGTGVILTGKELDAVAESSMTCAPTERKEALTRMKREVRRAYDAHSISEWASKCMISHRVGGAEVVMLSPASTDTRHWQDVIWRTASAICFVRGRLSFVGGPKGPAPMACALAYWGDRPQHFAREFSALGHCTAGALGWRADDRGRVDQGEDLSLPAPAGEADPRGVRASAGGGGPVGAPVREAAAEDDRDAAGPLVPQRGLRARP